VRTFRRVFFATFAVLVALFVLAGIFGHAKPKPASAKRPAAGNTDSQSGSTNSAKPTPRPSTHHHHHAVVVATGCHARDHGKLPDRRCTPGAVYRHVTQANIRSTICVSGWTDTVRPSESYTDGLKARQIARYHYTSTDLSLYEEDHLIPLELGGAPYSAKNLWPEYDSGVIPNPKDAVENALNNAVCDGRVSLRAAQHAIAVNWETAESVLGVNGSGGGGNGGGGGGTPTGCHPKTDSGNCYEPGEFCRDSDHGVTGVAGNGTPIKCEGSGSATWHWEPA
jgi:hypothetical protein